MLGSQRHLFDIPSDIAYLNCAYLSPLLNSVRAAGDRGVSRKAHPWTIERHHFFEELEDLRKLFARLINATADDVAIVPATSYGIAVAGANLPIAAGQTIVVLENQHASNFHQWRVQAAAQQAELVTVRRPDDDDWTSAVETELDDRTAIVAVPNCHWTDGSMVDLASVGRRCREVGAALVVDGTQSVGAMPFDVREVRPDFLACSGYKWLLCPYGLSFLYAAPHRQNGQPLEEHAWSRAAADKHEGRVDYVTEFQPGARRYDMGERSNFITVPMAVAALEQLLEWGTAAIADTLGDLTDHIAIRAIANGFNVPPPPHRARHMIGLRAPEGMPLELLGRLAAKGVYVSTRGNAIRVSPHLYNDEADLDRLFDALSEIL